MEWRRLANLITERLSMDSSGFDATRWEHWLLISCFVVMAAGGLWSSWQFKQAAKKRARQQRVRSRLARRLAMELGLPDMPSTGSVDPALADIDSARLWAHSAALPRELPATPSIRRRQRTSP